MKSKSFIIENNIGQLFFKSCLSPIKYSSNPIAKYSLAPDTFMRRAGNPVLYRTVDVVVEGYLVNAKNLTQDQRDEIATRRQQLRSDLRVF